MSESVLNGADVRRRGAWIAEVIVDEARNHDARPDDR
jgi:hypothetical protein